jgi:L-asparagine transporter-like permease
MSEEYEKKIQKLIANVDTAKNDFMDSLFKGVIDIAAIGLTLLAILVVQFLGLTIEEKVYVQLLITSSAFIISVWAFYSVIFPKWDKAFSGYKAGKMCKSLNYDEGTKVLLTALIFMKLRKPKTKLSTVYGLEPEIFTKKSLIQSLYVDH